MPSSPWDGLDPEDSGAGPDPDDAEFRPPLPPEDRLWRHPSEVAADARARTWSRPTAGVGSAPRPASTPKTMFVAAICIAAVFGAGVSLAAVAATGGWRTEVVERRIAVPVAAETGLAAVAAAPDATADHIIGLRVREGGEWRSANAVLYRSDGHALTSFVAVDGAERIDAYLPDGTPAAAEVIGVDRPTGVAVVRIDTDAMPALLGSTSALDPGDRLVSVSADAERAWATTVDPGTVSAVDMHLRNGTVALHDMVTLTVDGERPTPGCPVVDESGAVVGLVAGVIDDPTGEVALIPIDVAVDIADQLVERGEVDHVWLGVAGTDITPEEATAMSIPGGATVTEVLDNSPASGGGLLAGDAIVAVDDDAVTSMNELVTELRDRSPGDEVTLTVVRNGDEVETTVELGER